MRAAARTATAQWTDGRSILGQSGRRSSRRLREQAELFAAVGIRFAHTRVAALIAMMDSQAVRLPPCLVGGQPVVWDYWWPHLGIAVDMRPVDGVEEDAKVAWANEHGVLYCSPTVNGTERQQVNLPLLADTAASRRRG